MSAHGSSAPVIQKRHDGERSSVIRRVTGKAGSWHMQHPSPPSSSARQVVKRVARLPTAHRFRLAWRLVCSRRVPLRARLPLGALLLYLAMPLDIVPDFIPVLGQLDDLLIAGIAVWWFLRVCPPEVALEEI